jgi:hypothetical protein
VGLQALGREHTAWGQGSAVAVHFLGSGSSGLLGVAMARGGNSTTYVVEPTAKEKAKRKAIPL